MLKYAKNVLHEGLKLKGLILFAAIYQIGDPAFPFCFREYSTCSSNAEVVYDLIQFVTQLNVPLGD